jgi:hypothetical protein
MADDQAEIPERMQDRAQHVFFGGAELAAEEHEEIDVGMQKELPPSVPADGDDGDGLRRPRGGGVDVPDDRVEPIGEASERRAAAMSAENFVAQFATRFVELH